MGKHVKSKRTTLKHKYKVERKVREHHRQARRSARKNRRDNAISKKRLKKDPGIPNMYPYKQELMEELEAKRVEQLEKKKALSRERREARAAAAAGKSATGSIAELGAEAAARTANFDDGEDFDIAEGEMAEGRKLNADADTSRRAFMREFKRVVSAADVLLEVLDARDPLGCRCYDAERAVVSSGKRLVLVLNKVDLVPREVADKWLSYLRNEYPTLAFRASTQSGGTLGQARVSASAASAVGTSECMGAGNLLKLLKNYARNRKLKTSICVGVIGYPNVGKSSLINSLKRARAVSVGATPGVTRVAQEVRLDSNIALLDCPGIVFADANAEDALVLRNAVRIEQLVDVVKPVQTILSRVGAEPLMVAYALPQFANVTEFLALVCKKKGKYRRGGAFDFEAAARVVLGDWNSGKIPFYTLPPKGPQSAQLGATIVSQWGEEFDIDKVVAGERDDLASIRHDQKTKALFVEVAPSEPASMDAEMQTVTAVEPSKEGDVQQSYHVAKRDLTAEDAKKRERQGLPAQPQPVAGKDVAMEDAADN